MGWREIGAGNVGWLGNSVGWLGNSVGWAIGTCWNIERRRFGEIRSTVGAQNRENQKIRRKKNKMAK